MTTVLGPTPCHDCKTPVSIVKRTVEVPCRHEECYWMGDNPCPNHPTHDHTIRYVAVVEANGERHLCASNA
jgi:hypothetical protein